MRKYSYYFFSIFKLLFGIREWPLVMRIFLGLTPEGIYTIRLRKSGAKFQVRKAMDVWSVKETFLDRFYEKYGTEIGEGWKIVDIGAGIGEFTLFALLGHPQNFVYAFEPYPRSFDLLSDNLAANQIANAQIFPEAIGAETGTLALDLSSGEPLQIQSFSLDSASIQEEVLKVRSLSLEDAFNRLGLEACDLLKLDCEGAEYDILFHTTASVLGRIDRIVMEYHDNVTANTHQDLVKFLVSKDFAVKTFPNPVHDYLGYLSACRLTC